MWRLGFVFAAVVLAGCAGKPDVPATDMGGAVSPVEYHKADFSELKGFETDDLQGFAQAFGRSCEAIKKRSPDSYLDNIETGGLSGRWQQICDGFAGLNTTDSATVKSWLMATFTPYLVTYNGDKQGIFTGYYEAELKGSHYKTRKYNTPIYGYPADLVTIRTTDFNSALEDKTWVGRIEGGKVKPYPERGNIVRNSAFPAPVLAWVDPVDAFVLSIQGSGRVNVDGAVLRVGYAMSNGHKFVGIGSLMRAQGLLEPGKASMGHIRSWLKKNPVKASELMEQNPRYIFFRQISGEGPIGAQGVALTPWRSLAVDRRYIPLGAPVWLDSQTPDYKPLQRLMVAQDMGSAIKGGVRGDFFYGYGEDALKDAGRMKSSGYYYVLLPK